MKKLFLGITILTMLAISLCVYSKSVYDDLEEGIIRLHIPAHSDSPQDQQIKLGVRDAVLKATAGIDVRDQDRFLAEAQRSANEYLSANNVPYGASAQFGTFYFPQKTYGNITLPAGHYKGVRIVLGDGKGQNWWCVMYPPLCVNEKKDEAQRLLKSSLHPDTYDIITTKPQMKFKILEFIQALND